MLAKISFTGNKHVPSAVLRRILGVKAQWWPGNRYWLPGWGQFDIRMYYYHRGFRDAQISYRKHFSEDRTRLTLEYVIDEGVGDIDEAGATSAIEQVGAEVDPDFASGDVVTGGSDANSGASATESPEADSDRTAIPNLPDLRDLDRVVFTGVESFDAADIRRVLAYDFNTILAGHPGADLQHFVETLEKQIAAGYRHAGFPDAAIRAVANEGLHRIEVRVIEGPRYRCGDLKVIDMLPAEPSILAALIANADVLSGILKKGQLVPFDETTLAVHERERRAQFADAGYCQPRIRIPHQP